MLYFFFFHFVLFYLHTIQYYIRYAENQQLLDESEDAKSSLRATINILKAELRKKGINFTLSEPGIGQTNQKKTWFLFLFLFPLFTLFFYFYRFVFFIPFLFFLFLIIIFVSISLFFSFSFYYYFHCYLYFCYNFTIVITTFIFRYIFIFIIIFISSPFGTFFLSTPCRSIGFGRAPVWFEGREWWGNWWKVHLHPSQWGPKYYRIILINLKNHGLLKIDFFAHVQSIINILIMNNLIILLIFFIDINIIINIFIFM